MENLLEELREVVTELKQEFGEKYAKLESANTELQKEVETLEEYVQALRTDVDENGERDDVITMNISDIENSLVYQHRATENALSNIRYIENYLMTLSRTIPAPGYVSFSNAFGNPNMNRVNPQFASTHNAPMQQPQQHVQMQNVGNVNMSRPVEVDSREEYLHFLQKAGINPGGFQASPSNYQDENNTVRYR